MAETEYDDEVLDHLKEFVSANLKEKMTDASVLSFLSQIDQQRQSQRWHMNQVDTLMKDKCPDYESTLKGEDDVNVFMNNVIADKDALVTMMKRTKNSPAEPPSHAPANDVAQTVVKQEARQFPLWAQALAALALMGGGGLMTYMFMPAQPKFVDLSGLQLEVVETIEETLEGEIE